jgi:Leucine-rich repeat (LRR) protein/serine/threonine protein kinase
VVAATAQVPKPAPLLSSASTPSLSSSSSSSRSSRHVSVRRQPALLNLSQVRSGEAPALTSVPSTIGVHSSPATSSPATLTTTSATSASGGATSPKAPSPRAADAAADGASVSKTNRIRNMLGRLGARDAGEERPVASGARVKEGWIQRDGARRYLVLQNNAILLWSKTPLGAVLDTHDLNEWEVRRTTTDKGRIALELLAKSSDDARRNVCVLTGRDDVQTNEWLVACESVLLGHEAATGGDESRVNSMGPLLLARRRRGSPERAGPQTGWMRRNGRERWFALVGAHLYWFSAEQPLDMLLAADLRYRRQLMTIVAANSDLATTPMTPDSVLSKRALGSLDMRTTELEPSTSATNAFECRTATGKRYTLAAATRVAVKRWVHALCEAQTPSVPNGTELLGLDVALSPQRVMAQRLAEQRSSNATGAGIAASVVSSSSTASSSSSAATSSTSAAAAAAAAAARDPRVPVMVEGESQPAVAYIDGDVLVVSFADSAKLVARRLRLYEWRVLADAPPNTIKLVSATIEERDPLVLTSAKDSAALAQLRSTLVAINDLQDNVGRINVVLLAGADAQRTAVFGAARRPLRVCGNVPADDSRVTVQLLDKTLMDTATALLTAGRAPSSVQRIPSSSSGMRHSVHDSAAVVAAAVASTLSPTSSATNGNATAGGDKGADVRGALLVLDFRDVDAGLAAWDAMCTQFDMMRPRVPGVLIVAHEGSDARALELLRVARTRLSEFGVFVMPPFVLQDDMLTDDVLREPLAELTRLVRAAESPSRIYIPNTTFHAYGCLSSSFEIECVVYNASESLVPFAVQHNGDLDGDVALALPDGFVGALKRGRNTLSIVLLCNRAVEAEKFFKLQCGGETTTLLVRFASDLVTSFYLSLLYQHYDFSAADRYVPVHKQLIEMRSSRLAARRSLALTAAQTLSHSRKYRLPPAAHRAAAIGAVNDVPALRMRRRQPNGDGWRTQLVVELSATFCGVTPLYVAAAFGQSSFVAEMLTLVGSERALHLAQFCTSDNDMRCQSLLHVAAVHAQGRVITAVLNALPLPPFIDAADGVPLGRCTALHCAAQRGPLEAGVVELLQGGADFRAQDLRGEPAINPSTWATHGELAVGVFLPAVSRAALKRPHITLINLANCELPGLPDVFFHLVHLKVVDLSLNSIAVLPPAVSQLTNLAELYIGFNQLRELPEQALKSLPALEVLDVKGNPLSVEARLAAIAAVRERRLELNGVDLPTLPLERLATLTYLEELVVHACGVTHLPAFGSRSTPMLPSLRVLSLSNNELSSFASNCLASLAASLVELDLSDNQLTSLPSGISRLTRLRRLLLASNRLARMPGALPASCVELSVAYNRGIHRLPGAPVDAGSVRSPPASARRDDSLALVGGPGSPPSSARLRSKRSAAIDVLARRTPSSSTTASPVAQESSSPASRRGTTTGGSGSGSPQVARSGVPRGGARPVTRPMYYGTWDPSKLQIALDGVKSSASPSPLSPTAQSSIATIDASFRDADSDEVDDDGSGGDDDAYGDIDEAVALGASGRTRTRRKRSRQIRLDVGSYSQLQVLDISALSLTASVDLTLVHVTALRVLTVNETEIATWPESLTRLCALESLTMRGNRLREIPAAVQSLTALEVLRLEHNSIEMVASHIGTLSRLRTLALDHNRLLRLPAAIGHLRALHSLSVSSNPSLSWPPQSVVSRGTRAMLEAAQRELTRPSHVRRVPLVLLGDNSADIVALRRALLVACDPALQELELDKVDAVARVDGARVTPCATTRDENQFQFDIVDGIDALAWRHAHPLLLRSGAVCLVVFDARRANANASLAHWFSSVTRAAPTVPILLVATHVDELAAGGGDWERALDSIYSAAFDMFLSVTPSLKRVVCGVTSAAFLVRHRRDSVVGASAASVALSVSGSMSSAAALASAGDAMARGESTGIDWLIERCCVAALESDGAARLPPERVVRLEKLLAGMATTRKVPLMRMDECRGVAALCDVLGGADVAAALQAIDTRGVIALLSEMDDIVVLRPTWLIGQFSVLLRRQQALMSNVNLHYAWHVAGLPTDAHAPVYAHLAYLDLIVAVPKVGGRGVADSDSGSSDDGAGGSDDDDDDDDESGNGVAPAPVVAPAGADATGTEWDDIAPAPSEQLHRERQVASSMGLSNAGSALLPAQLELLPALDASLAKKWWQPGRDRFVRLFEHRPALATSSGFAMPIAQLRGVLVARFVLAVRLRQLCRDGAIFSHGSARVRLEVRASVEDGAGCDVELQVYGPGSGAVLATLVEIVRATHDDWYDVQPREVALCPHCMASSKRRQTPYRFALADLEDAVLRRSMSLRSSETPPPVIERLSTPDLMVRRHQHHGSNESSPRRLESGGSASRIGGSLESDDGRSSVEVSEPTATMSMSGVVSAGTADDQSDELASANDDNGDDAPHNAPPPAVVVTPSAPVTLAAAAAAAHAATEAELVVQCRWSSKRSAVPIALVAPDVAMTYGPRVVAPTNLELGAAIAGGAYGTVFLGTLAIDSGGRSRSNRLSTGPASVVATASAAVDATRPIRLSDEVSSLRISLPVAVKQLTPSSFVGESRTAAFGALRRELWTLAMLERCDRIVQLRGVSLGPLSLVTEILPVGDLLALIARRRLENVPFTQSFMVCVAADIAVALAFMHSHTPPLIHRDVKSPNVLLMSASEHRASAKLADLGSARVGVHFKRSDVDQIRWLAPEVMRHEPYDAKSDVYSFGIVLSELLARRHPFEDRGQQWEYQLQDEIIGGARPTLPADASPSLVALARRCWDDSPHVRPSSRHLAKDLGAMRDALPPPPSDDRAVQPSEASGTPPPRPALLARDDSLMQLSPPAQRSLVAPLQRKSGGLKSSLATTRARPASDAMLVGTDDSMDSASASDIDDSSSNVAVVPVKRLPSIAGAQHSNAFVRASMLLSAMQLDELRRELDDDDDDDDNDDNDDNDD